jgi:transposase
VLTFEQRLEVVKHLENGKRSREIAQIMGVGRTQIQILTRGRRKFWKIMRITFHQTENENNTKQGTKRLMIYVNHV